MTDAELRDIYTRSLTSRAQRAECPTPEAIEALVARTGSEASRLATLDHVMSCGACKQEFELLRAIHAAERVNAGAARPRRSLAPWLAAAVVVIAAGALTLTQIQRPGSNPPRGSSSSDIALAGVVNGNLVWHAIPGAVRYDVEIVDASGSTIFHARVADTVAAMPATLPSAPVSWWVRATLRDGSERRSAIIPLR